VSRRIVPSYKDRFVIFTTCRSTRSSPSRSSSSIDVGVSLEASWCGADGPDSEGGRSAPGADCPALLAKLSAIPVG
jgi:hypothetical protein